MLSNFRSGHLLTSGLQVGGIVSRAGELSQYTRQHLAHLRRLSPGHGASSPKSREDAKESGAQSGGCAPGGECLTRKGSGALPAGSSPGLPPTAGQPQSGPAELLPLTRFRSDPVSAGLRSESSSGSAAPGGGGELNEAPKGRAAEPGGASPPPPPLTH